MYLKEFQQIKNYTILLFPMVYFHMFYNVEHLTVNLSQECILEANLRMYIKISMHIWF